MPAEYEPIGAVVMGWTICTPCSPIAKAITGPGKAQLWAVAGPSSISGVPAPASYTRIDAPLNTVWTRDYGPVGISAGTGRPGIVDSIYRRYDDAVPGVIGKAC